MSIESIGKAAGRVDMSRLVEIAHNTEVKGYLIFILNKDGTSKCMCSSELSSGDMCYGHMMMGIDIRGWLPESTVPGAI